MTMKKSMIAACALAAAAACAEEGKPAAELAPESSWTDALSFYANTGVFSGYQLYGSLVNSEPTIQGYAQLAAKLSVDEFDLGTLAVGCWFNNDLTGKRADHHGVVRRAFNEFDPQFSWSRSFWFDDDQQYGLTYKTSFVWYYYPHPSSRRKVDTTMDWNHYVELANPFVVPYANFVHEYHESDGNLIQFGLKKTVGVGEQLRITPTLEFVWRNTNYGWCFPNYGYNAKGEKINSCLATMRVGADLNYRLCDNVGLFAKLYYCSVVDDDMRDAADHASGNAYGKYKDFAWGGIGIEVFF